MHYVVAYVPVLHEGYRRFFESIKGPKTLYIVGPDFIAPHREMSRDIRLLNPELMRTAISALGMFDHVEVLTLGNISVLKGETVYLPDEDVSRELGAEHLKDSKLEFKSVFLRWDKHNSVAEKPVVPDEMITKDELHRRLVAVALQESEKSSDNWRHVGALVGKNGEVLMQAHNRHVPSEHMPYLDGDPRNNFRRGVNIELSTALHAEAGLIAEAARRGLSLEGSDMYVTTFPCPPCAKLIAYSGIKTLYCGGGHSVLDGESILKERGIRIIFVE